MRCCTKSLFRCSFLHGFVLMAIAQVQWTHEHLMNACIYDDFMSRNELKTHTRIVGGVCSHGGVTCRFT